MDKKIAVPTPPWTGLGKKLESMCRKALFDYEMVDGAKKIGVALSGGKDSLSLLFLLKAISGKGFPPFTLHPIHISGEFSCGAGVNISFLKRVCDALELPLIVRDEKQKLENLECYSCSRKRRHLLFEAAKEIGANTIAFGHHRDDSIQTLLMNLLHKGEFAANLPTIWMEVYQMKIIRPLIYVGENDLIRFSKFYGFSRITCQCPVGQQSMRRKTKELIEQIEKLFPNVKNNLHIAGMLYGSKKASLSPQKKEKYSRN